MARAAVLRGHACQADLALHAEIIPRVLEREVPLGTRRRQFGPDDVAKLAFGYRLLPEAAGIALFERREHGLSERLG